MMESTTTIDLTDTDAPTQETSIDEIHIETTEERFIYLQIFYLQLIIFPWQWNRSSVFSGRRKRNDVYAIYILFICLGTIWLHFVLETVTSNLYTIWIGDWFGWLLERQAYVTHCCKM